MWPAQWSQDWTGLNWIEAARRTFLETELVVAGSLEVVESDEELRVFVEVTAQQILLRRPPMRRIEEGERRGRRHSTTDADADASSAGQQQSTHSAVRIAQSGRLDVR